MFKIRDPYINIRLFQQSGMISFNLHLMFLSDFSNKLKLIVNTEFVILFIVILLGQIKPKIKRYKDYFVSLSKTTELIQLLYYKDIDL